MRKRLVVRLAFLGIMLLVQNSQAISQEKHPIIPETIHLGLLKFIFEPVIFPHLDHAHMSQMGEGCITCHHYSDENIYDPCETCHSNSAKDLNDGIISLNAAFHRKCLACHRDWNSGNVCGTCHVKRKTPDLPESAQTLKHKSPRRYPQYVNFQTVQAEMTKVLFHHAEHVELFRFDCASCHRSERCKTCHGAQQIESQINGKGPIRHYPCSTCHDTELETTCQKCHSVVPSSGFSHDMTGFPLKSFHQNRECTACHDPLTPVKKLDQTCTQCHNNFELDSFDHAATGIVLEMGHEELDCIDCHLEDRFDQLPNCDECHEGEVSYPTDLPGRSIK